jgi:hypothetical protein
VDEAAFFKDLQVLDDGGKSDLERLGQMRDRDGAFAKFFNDGAAGGIAERMKNAVDRGLLRVHDGLSFVRIFESRLYGVLRATKKSGSRAAALQRTQ